MPIPELLESGPENITWNLRLPDYVPAERIGVNVDRLQRCMRLGGLDSLIVNSYDGERTEYQDEITGVDHQAGDCDVL